MQIFYIKSRIIDSDEFYTFVSFEKYRTLSDVASLLYSDEYRSKVHASSAIILRPPVEHPIDNLDSLDEGIASVVDRFELTPVYILYSNDFKIKLSGNRNKKAIAVADISDDKLAFCEYIRKKEMCYFILDSSAIFKTPTPNIYFRTPSQEYSHTFLRVGNIQKNRYVLDSIFFWTLPHLKDKGAILTDSWSISSIALNIARLLARYISKTEGKLPSFINNFHVNMLSTHYHGLRGVDQETKECLQPLIYNNEKNILFIISAIKTSKSLINIKKAIKNAVFEDNVNYLVLYRLIEDVEEVHLCDLSGDFCNSNDVNFDSLPEPPPGSHVVPIDEQSFFPLDVKDNLIEIKKAGADMSKNFFETYSGKGVLSLHRKSFYENNTPIRHHGIFIDVSKMLLCDEFLEKLYAQIEKIPQLPSCIIFPPHLQGRELAMITQAKLQEKFNESIDIYCFADFETLSDLTRKQIIDHLQSLQDEDLVLVIDDVSVSGGRLFTYQRNVLTHFGGKVWYLVGVARPESEDLWQRRRNILQVNRGTLEFVEKVILPDWNESKCPWCLEKHKLTEIIANPEYTELSVLKQLEVRLGELIQAETLGLIDNVFFKLGTPAKPPFIGNSIFCTKTEIQEADMFSSVASTLQHLRNGFTSPKNGILYKLSTGHPVYSIIEPDDFLNGSQKLFEPFIKASVLRAAKHQELYATEDENRQKQKLHILEFLEGKYLSENDKSFFLYELYVAMKLGKIPKPAIPENLRFIIDSYFRTGTGLPLSN